MLHTVLANEVPAVEQLGSLVGRVELSLTLAALRVQEVDTWLGVHDGWMLGQGAQVR